MSSLHPELKPPSTSLAVAPAPLREMGPTPSLTGLCRWLQVTESVAMPGLRPAGNKHFSSELSASLPGDTHVVSLMRVATDGCLMGR